MRGRLRNLLIMLLAGLVLPATPARADPPGLSAAERWGACVAGSGHGDLLVLFDQSSSLQSSDPADQRVAAAKYLLSALAESAAAGGVNLNVKLDGFDVQYRPGGQWLALDQPGLQQALNEAEAFRDRDNGEGTDYWLAMEGARRTFAERAKGQEKTCFATLWFTDGALTVAKSSEENDYTTIDRPYDPGNSLETQEDQARAAAAATESLCRAGGLADQIRSMNIAVLGVGLASSQTDGGTFDLMRRIVTGGSASGACGELVDPVPGDFTEVSDIDGLLFAFNKIRDFGRGPIEHQKSLCVDAPCPEGTHTVVLDDSVGAVNILAGVEMGDARIVLIAPDGRQVTLEAGQIGTANGLPPDFANGSVTWHTKRTGSIKLSRDGTTGWVGAWHIVFLDTSGNPTENSSRTSIQIMGDLKPTWTDQVAEVRQGDRLAVSVGLVSGSGQMVTADTLLSAVDLRVEVITADGKTRELASGGKQLLGTTTLLPAAELPLGQGTVRISSTITTAPWTDPNGGQVPGTTLATEVLDLPLQVRAPVGYPTIAGQVNFGSAVGEPRLHADLAITGPGCVWLQPADTVVKTSPEGIGEISLTSASDSPDSCVEVAAEAQGALPLDLRAAGGGNGGLSGVMMVRIAPLEDPSRVQDVPVTFSADLAKPLRPLNFALAFGIALILGPAIPLLLMYLIKALIAARIPGHALVGQRFDVTFEHGSILRDGAPFSLGESDLRTMVPMSGSGARAIQVDGVELRARAGWSPFGAPEVHIRVPDTPGVLSASDTMVRPAKGIARLPLGVHNHWVLLVDPAAPAGSGQLLLLVSGTAVSSQRQRIVDDLRTRAPGAYDHLRALVPPRAPDAPPAAPEPAFRFDGGPQGPGNSPFGNLTG